MLCVLIQSAFNDYPDIALDKLFFSTFKYLYFSYFSTKTYVVGTL